MRYSFNDLSAQEVQLLLAALAELPIKIAAPLYTKLEAQLQAQASPLPDKI